MRRLSALWQRHSLVRSAAILFSWSMFGKGMTFAREICTAYYFGTTVFKDGFVAAFSLATLLYAPFLEAVTKLTVPKYLSYPKPRAFVGVFSIQLLFLFGCIFLLFFPAKQWVLGHIYGMLVPEAMSVLSDTIAVMILYSVLFVFTTFFAQILNAAGYYGVSEARNVIFSGVAILFIAGRISVWGIHPLVGGYLVGVSLMAVYLVGAMLRYRLVTLQITVSDFKEIWRHTGVFWKKFMAVSCLSLVSVASGIAVQQRLALIGPQILSANDYALRCFSLISTLFVPLLTPVYTQISEMAALGVLAWSFLKRIMLILIVTGLGISVAMVFFGKPFLAALFLRGAFNQESLELTFSFLSAYIWLTPLASVALLLEYVLMAYGMNRTYAASIMLSGGFFWAFVALVPSQSFYVIPIGMAIAALINVLFRFVMVLKRVARST